MSFAKKLNAADFAPEVSRTPEEVETAKLLAKHYKHKLKLSNIYHNPWRLDVPLELQNIFAHFVKAAKIVIEENAEPEDFIEAQFAGLAWTRKPPFPSQLHSENARLRLIEYVSSKQDDSLKQLDQGDYMLEEFSVEERKAKKLSKQLHVSVKRVLRECCSEFSQEFLKHKGVWSKVRDQYREAQ